ncbi:MAG TPA: hypothetical protein VGC31_03520 [Paenirhodobacter sp.]
MIQNGPNAIPLPLAQQTAPVWGKGAQTVTRPVSTAAPAFAAVVAATPLDEVLQLLAAAPASPPATAQIRMRVQIYLAVLRLLPGPQAEASVALISAKGPVWGMAAATGYGAPWTGGLTDAEAILTQLTGGRRGIPTDEVTAGLVGGVSGREGTSVITVNAVMAAIAALVGKIRWGPDGDRPGRRRPSARDRLEGEEEVDGAVDDVPAVAGAAPVVAVGCTRDDLARVSGRTISAHRGLAGDERIAIEAGSDVIVQLRGHGPDDYTVTRQGDSLRIAFGGQAVTFTGMALAGSVTVTLADDRVILLHRGEDAPVDRRV